MEWNAALAICLFQRFVQKHILHRNLLIRVLHLGLIMFPCIETSEQCILHRQASKRL